MRGVFLRNVGALWALWISCFVLNARALNYVGLVCRMTPWKTQCKNHIQAHVMGLAVISSGDVSEAADCMVHVTEEKCNSAVTLNHKAPCAWCPTPPYYRSRFGNGGCTLKRMKDMGGCGYLPKLVYDPAIATNIPTPSVSYEGRCLKRSASAALCEENVKPFDAGDSATFPCRYCEIEDAYGIKKPSKNLCLPMAVTNPTINPAHDWCRLLNDLPSNIAQKNLDWSKSPLSLNRSYRLRRNAFPGYGGTNVAEGDPAPHFAAEGEKDLGLQFPTSMIWLLHELVKVATPEDVALYRDGQNPNEEKATLPNLSPAQSEVSAKTPFSASTQILPSEANSANKSFDILFAYRAARNRNLKRHAQAPILFRRSGTVAIPPILTTNPGSDEKGVKRTRTVLTVPCFSPECNCHEIDSDNTSREPSQELSPAESIAPAEMTGLATSEPPADPTVNENVVVSTEDIEGKAAEKAGPVAPSTTPVKPSVSETVLEDQEFLPSTSSVSSKAIPAVAKTSAATHVSVDKEIVAESEVQCAENVERCSDAENAVGVKAPSEITVTQRVETPSQVLATQRVATPSEVQTSQGVETPSEVLATQVGEKAAKVLATQEVETASKISVSKEMEIPAEVPATQAAEAPAAVPATQAAEAPATIPATEAVEVPAEVLATQRVETPAAVPATEAVETPSQEPETEEVETTSEKPEAQAVVTPFEEAETKETQMFAAVPATAEVPATTEAEAEEAQSFSGVPDTTEAETEKAQRLSEVPATTKAETEKAQSFSEVPAITETQILSHEPASKTQPGSEMLLTEGVQTLVVVPETEAVEAFSEGPATEGLEMLSVVPWIADEVPLSTTSEVSNESAIAEAPDLEEATKNPTPQLLTPSSVSTEPPVGAASIPAGAPTGSITTS